MTYLRLDLSEDFFGSSHGLLIRTVGFDLWDLTLDDLEGSKTKVTVLDVKYMDMILGHTDSSSLDLLPKILGLFVTIVPTYIAW